MASDAPRPPGAADLVNAKLERMRALLVLTQEQLLLAQLEPLGPLLEKKEALIEEIQTLDRQLTEVGEETVSPAQAEDWRAELARLVEAILANERTMEERMQAERARVRGQLQDLERQNRVKRYLESTRPQGRKVDLTR